MKRNGKTFCQNGRGGAPDARTRPELTSSQKGAPVVDLRNPPTVQEIAEAIRSCADATGMAAAVYAESVRVTDTSRPEGRVYLQDLAEVLALPAPLVRRIHEATGAIRTGEAPVTIRALRSA